MRKCAVVCMMLCLLSASRVCAEDWGLIKQTDRLVRVHKKPSGESRVVHRLKPGTKVKVDFLQGSWWAVFKLSEERRSEQYALGYVSASLLKPASQTVLKVWSDSEP